MPEASPPRRRLAPRRQAANVGLALLTRSGSPATMRPIGAAATAGVLAVVVAACGQREEPAGEPPPHGTRLVVTVRPGGPGGMPDVREIECLPHARRLPCVRLETVEVEDFAPVPAGVRCTAIYGGPATASVRGRLRGRRVDARFSLRNGCEIARWERFAWLLGDPPAGITPPL